LPSVALAKEGLAVMQVSHISPRPARPARQTNKVNELKINDFDLKQYDYNLPPERIAQYPARERDLSKLLIYKDNLISGDIFRNIDQYLPSGSLLVFNNTRVIRARIMFRKETGAAIEVLCLKPLAPAKYSL